MTALIFFKWNQIPFGKCGSQVCISITQLVSGAAVLAPPRPQVRGSQEPGRASMGACGGGWAFGPGEWSVPQIMLYKQTRQPLHPEWRCQGLELVGGGGAGAGKRRSPGGLGRGPELKLGTAQSLASIGIGVGGQSPGTCGVPVLRAPSLPSPDPVRSVLDSGLCSVSHPLGNEPVFFARSVDLKHYFFLIVNSCVFVLRGGGWVGHINSLHE